jgi:hypothetical protein
MNDACIFIGSSTEALPAARAVAKVVSTLGGNVIGWWDGDAFPVGYTTMQCLERIGRRCNAAIIVLSPDDRTYKRGREIRSARDNMLFECGYVAALYGLHRAPIVRLGNVEVPSDLLGITLFQRNTHPQGSDWNAASFENDIKTDLRIWLSSLMDEIDSPTKFPGVEAAMQNAIACLNAHRGSAHDFDLLASSVLHQIAELLGDHGITEDLITTINTQSMRSAVSLFAVDVLGPKGWLQPATYRYLAAQIRPYIRKNLRGNEWHIVVSGQLKQAIQTAVSNAHKRIGHSLTLFDNPAELHWEGGEPKLQMARILRWSREELRSPMAATIIDIHEAFHVPLFFLPATQPERQVDYILFTEDSGKRSGFWGTAPKYETHTLAGPLPVIGDAWGHFHGLLSNPELLFARDAQQLERNLVSVG